VERRSYVRVRTGALFFAAQLALAAALTTGCSPEAPPVPPASDVLRIGAPESGFDAPDLGIRFLAATFTHEGLFFIDDDGRPAPRLAQGWKWTPDHLRLLIQLRADVRLHDGTAVTSSMVADALRRGVARPANQMQSWALDSIASIDATGADEVTVTLTREAGAIVEDLTFPLSFGPSNAGTGPYRVTPAAPETPAGSTVLTRLDRHYRGQPAIRQVVISGYPTLRMAWTSLLRGEIDVVTSVPSDAVAFLGSQRVTSASFLRAYQYQLAFNSRREPFTSPAVRKALNMAIDREHLMQRVFGGKALRADGPLWARHWTLGSDEPRYTFDTVSAGKALDAAHLSLGRPDKRAGQPLRFTFRCLVPAGFRTEERIALELERQLALIGVGIQFDVQPPQQYDAKIRSGDFDAVLVNMIGGPTFNRPHRFFRSGRPVELNVFGYENPEAERLFDVLKTSHDESALRTAAKRLQRVFHEDPPTLPLAWEERTRAFSRDSSVTASMTRSGDPLAAITLRTTATRSTP
jgi:peptide/nickel transport system substrate-binding protein